MRDLEMELEKKVANKRERGVGERQREETSFSVHADLVSLLFPFHTFNPKNLIRRVQKKVRRREERSSKDEKMQERERGAKKEKRKKQDVKNEKRASLQKEARPS